MADLAIGRARAKMADLSMALEGRFTDHHAMMCRLHLDAIALHDAGIADLDARIAARAAPWKRETELLKTIPGFGDTVAWTWIAGIGPAPHEWSGSDAKLASWAGLAPGSYVSAGKRGYGRTGEAGTYIKPVLVQAAWAAVRTPGRLQARYSRLVRRMGGERNPAAKKKAIVAIARTLLKIAYSVLRTGSPYQDLGADFYTRRQQPAHRQAWLEKQLRSLHPGCTVTVTITESPPLPGHVPEAVLPPPRPPADGSAAGYCRAPRQTPFSCQAGGRAAKAGARPAKAAGRPASMASVRCGGPRLTASIASTGVAGRRRSI